jgi:hypothetical protein
MTGTWPKPAWREPKETSTGSSTAARGEDQSDDRFLSVTPAILSPVICRKITGDKIAGVTGGLSSEAHARQTARGRRRKPIVRPAVRGYILAFRG